MRSDITSTLLCIGPLQYPSHIYEHQPGQIAVYLRVYSVTRNPCKDVAYVSAVAVDAIADMSYQ